MGSLSTQARFSVSVKTPSSVAPSPKNAAVVTFRPIRLSDKANPNAIGRVLPTIGTAPQKPASRSMRCIEPPRPPQHPCTRPYSSAIMA